MEVSEQTTYLDVNGNKIFNTFSGNLNMYGTRIISHDPPTITRAPADALRLLSKFYMKYDAINCIE